MKNPVPKACKLEDEMYHPPHEPMDTETSNKVRADLCKICDFKENGNT